ncbi:MAG: hypothetical protein OEQ47_07105 [Acidimicrobiia bacterium]|nr:hypothetical protein [Acidimicrobiia bacterium]
MDWWLVPVGLGVAVLLRVVWVAFHTRETVSAMPELDGYVPGGSREGDPLEATEPRTGPAAGGARDGEDAGGDGIWIELDIEPLFSSSETARIVDLTEEQDPEATP